MHHISLSLSPKQASKLRNGHKVRVKKGTGFNLIVSPHTYDIVSRSFRKGKGAEIALSPEELELNKTLTPEMHQEMREKNPSGEGLFKRKVKGGDLASDIRDAFNPNKNGVARAFDPNQNGVARAFDPNQNGVAKAFDPNQNGVAKAFSPSTGNDIKNLLLENLPAIKDLALSSSSPEDFGKKVASILIHQGIPLAAQVGASALADMAVVALGNPELAPVASILAGQAGKAGGTELANYIGSQTGYGIRGRRRKGGAIGLARPFGSDPRTWAPKGKGLKQDAEKAWNDTRNFLGVGLKQDVEKAWGDTRNFLGVGLHRHKRGGGLSAGDFGIVSPLVTQGNLDYLRRLDEDTGSHYSNLARSTIENARANELGEQLTKLGINNRREAHNIMGNGVRVMPREGEYIPQALMSQPLSANYQFRHFFPTNFQLMTKETEGEFMHGMGLGLGLGLGVRKGKGLYL